MRILDSLDKYSLSNSPVSLPNEIVEYDKLETMSQLLEASLGKKIMDVYLVNQDLDVLKENGYVAYYLNADFNHCCKLNG